MEPASDFAYKLSSMGLAFFIFLVFYFLPTIVAVSKGKRNKWAIFALNFFLGFTVIGWIISLVWSLTHDGIVVVEKK